MAGYRFWLRSSLLLVLILASTQAVNAQDIRPEVLVGPFTVEWSEIHAALGNASSTSSTCKVYSLADLDDPNLCKWIAETIPEMIQPASWKNNGAKVSYFAPSKVLVVNNTMAVHNQVDEFLQGMKKSTAQAKMKRDPHVLPAQFTPAERVGPVQSGPMGYPVPYPPATPKHLFHFIIRYEGEGIIDSNVVKFAKALAQANATPPNCSSPPSPLANTPTFAVPTTSLQPVGPPPPSNSGTPAPFLTSPLGASPMPPADAPTPPPPPQPMPMPMLPPVPF